MQVRDTDTVSRIFRAGEVRALSTLDLVMKEKVIKRTLVAPIRQVPGIIGHRAEPCSHIGRNRRDTKSLVVVTETSTRRAA